MRQLGIEAAKKAEDAKAKARAAAAQPFGRNTEVDNRSKREIGEAEKEGQAKETVNSEGEAEELEGIGEGLDEDVGTEEGEGEVKDGEVEHQHGTLEPKVAATGQKEERQGGDGRTKELEEHGGLENPGSKGAGDTQRVEETRDQDNTHGRSESRTDTKHVTAATDEAEDLPGKKTQEQAAARGEEAGDSVGD